MATRFLLGPSISEVVELPSTIPTSAIVEVNLDTPAIAPGGKVYVTIDPTAVGLRPLRVYAIFIPQGQQPVGDARRAEAFMNIMASFMNSVDIPSTYTDPPGPISNFEIVVPGVIPGTYYVQVVCEYPF